VQLELNERLAAWRNPGGLFLLPPICTAKRVAPKGGPVHQLLSEMQNFLSGLRRTSPFGRQTAPSLRKFCIQMTQLAQGVARIAAAVVILLN
jgi:hypothetical protein